MSLAAQVVDPQSVSDSKNKVSITPYHKSALWTVQVLWSVFFSITGFGKIVCYKPELWNEALHEVPWFSAAPQDLFIFIGVCEFLGAIGLILPAITGVKPKLTSFAAFGLTLVMILAAAFHIARGEYSFVLVNLVLGGVAAFIAYWRFFCEAHRVRADQLLPPTKRARGPWRVDPRGFCSGLVQVDTHSLIDGLVR
jgi:uncharacterized membrane protein YphA (DoxX/SURF4 family)